MGHYRTLIKIHTAPFIEKYIKDLNDSLEQHQPGAGLTFTQKTWLSFCFTG